MRPPQYYVEQAEKALERVGDHTVYGPDQVQLAAAWAQLAQLSATLGAPFDDELGDDPPAEEQPDSNGP